ncbi:hypothetical protein U9M48_024703 [Paspalum notatum var. saurae]|uniref:Uncharacterized protein n=1 Tax=Paspalum notatum var. saurae TaxID=547442 RepID=A0AAQ3WX97_PASNO
MKSSKVIGPRFNALRCSAEPWSNLAHGSQNRYTGDSGWYASYENVHDARRKQPVFTADVIRTR